MFGRVSLSFSERVLSKYTIPFTPTGLYANVWWCGRMGTQYVRPFALVSLHAKGFRIDVGGILYLYRWLISDDREGDWREGGKSHKGQTRLKLRDSSTVYVQIEECLSVSWGHHKEVLIREQVQNWRTFYGKLCIVSRVAQASINWSQFPWLRMLLWSIMAWMISVILEYIEIPTIE